MLTITHLKGQFTLVFLLSPPFSCTTDTYAAQFSEDNPAARKLVIPDDFCRHYRENIMFTLTFAPANAVNCLATFHGTHSSELLLEMCLQYIQDHGLAAFDGVCSIAASRVHRNVLFFTVDSPDVIQRLEAERLFGLPNFQDLTAVPFDGFSLLQERTNYPCTDPGFWVRTPYDHPEAGEIVVTACVLGRVPGSNDWREVELLVPVPTACTPPPLHAQEILSFEPPPAEAEIIRVNIARPTIPKATPPCATRAIIWKALVAIGRPELAHIAERTQRMFDHEVLHSLPFAVKVLEGLHYGHTFVLCKETEDMPGDQVVLLLQHHPLTEGRTRRVTIPTSHVKMGFDIMDTVCWNEDGKEHVGWITGFDTSLFQYTAVSRSSPITWTLGHNELRLQPTLHQSY
ncbi:hypothetical protein DFP72DRAFT_1084609 [Ephemerocybe angulata]|uniref:Uncharacterized protein n=1 Tax=Ephemerocybe angulata TaxID=980116 RepID=A0A8H6H6D4_9AGAR|nr:hypothetical protein DFP72DRAFT_1084609 [Tulosesus angulatus]